jgi:eukaryotic-like serine/threonine-protein kinase
MVAGLPNLRLSTVMIAATVITLLFLPLTAISTNNNTLLQSESAFAQQEEEITFLPYDNPIYGIFIQYPSDWTASTSGLEDYIDVIAFYSPLQNVSDSFPARLKISVPVYSQNISLQEYTNFVLTTLNQSEQIDVRNSSEVTVAGYPGYRVVLANQPFQNSTLIFYQMNTWTTIGNKVYLLTYEGEESTFNQHLPEVSRMMESLSISSSNNNMTTTAD